ncbi:hypothetical protein HDU76_008527, partial [Blyttiomyces sp. JEL0837]
MAQRPASSSSSSILTSNAAIVSSTQQSSTMQSSSSLTTNTNATLTNSTQASVNATVSQSTIQAPSQSTSTSSPSTNPVAPVALIGTVNSRYGSSSHLIPDQGRILYTGGFGLPNAATPVLLPSSENAVIMNLVDPFRQQQPPWGLVPAGSLGYGRAYGCSVASSVAVLFDDGDVNFGAGGDDVKREEMVVVEAFGFDGRGTLSSDISIFLASQNLQTRFNASQTASPNARYAPICTLINPTTLLLHGGLSAAGSPLQDTWYLNLSSAAYSDRAWSVPAVAGAGSTAPPPLFGHAAALAGYDGNVYIVGGLTVNSSVSDPVVFPGGIPGTEVVGGFLAGGGMPGVKSFESVWVFNSKSGFSERGTSAASGSDGIPSPRWGHSLVSVSPSASYLLMFGGANVNLTTSYNELWKLDLNNFQWTLLNNTGPARHSHNAVGFNDVMVISFGANTAIGATSPNLIPDPTVSVWDARVGGWGDFPARAVVPVGSVGDGVGGVKGGGGN